MKKTVFALAAVLAVLAGTLVVYVNMSFRKIGGVSTGQTITQWMPGKPAVLVIDVQEGITGTCAKNFTRSMVEQSAPFIGKVNQVISLAQGQNIPVIYIRQEGTDKLINFLTGNLLAPGDPSAALDARVQVVSDLEFTKAKMDAFSNRAFEAYLRNDSITHMYVTGLSALACVDRTIRAALNRGYAVTAVTDAIIGEKVKAKEKRC